MMDEFERVRPSAEDVMATLEAKGAPARGADVLMEETQDRQRQGEFKGVK